MNNNNNKEAFHMLPASISFPCHQMFLNFFLCPCFVLNAVQCQGSLSSSFICVCVRAFILDCAPSVWSWSMAPTTVYAEVWILDSHGLQHQPHCYQGFYAQSRQLSSTSLHCHGHSHSKHGSICLVYYHLQCPVPCFPHASQISQNTTESIPSFSLYTLCFTNLK